VQRETDYLERLQLHGFGVNGDFDGFGFHLEFGGRVAVVSSDLVMTRRHISEGVGALGIGLCLLNSTFGFISNLGVAWMEIDLNV